MARIIDSHAHILVRQTTPDFGDEPWRLEVERVPGGQIIRNSRQAPSLIPREITDVSDILKDMTEMRIDTMAICPLPGLLLYGLPLESALRTAQIQNGAIAGLCHDQ